MSYLSICQYSILHVPISCFTNDCTIMALYCCFRLYSLIKDHTTHIEETEKQLLALENEKIQLLEFIGENHLLLPKHLRSTLQRTPLYRPPNSPTSPSKTIMRGGSVSTIASSKSNAYTVAMDTLRGKSAASRDRNLHSNSGYAEEVDVDVVESSSSNYFAETQITALSTTDRLGPPKKSYEFKESTSSKTGLVLYVKQILD